MKLIALRCPACGHPLAPDDQDVVIPCASCGVAVQMDRSGVAEADVLYAEPSTRVTLDNWLPFWIFYGQVNLKRRSIQERGSLGEVAHAFWAEPRRFYIPAWEISLRTAREMGGALLRAQPRYRAVSRPEGAALVPARLRAEDAEKLIEFIVLDLEVRREDWLTGLEFSVEVDSAALWAVPAEQAGKGWRLAAAVVS